MSKLQKSLSIDLAAINKVIRDPYVKGVNYLQAMDERKELADYLHHIALNRSFINLGLKNVMSGIIK